MLNYIKLNYVENYFHIYIYIYVYISTLDTYFKIILGRGPFIEGVVIPILIGKTMIEKIAMRNDNIRCLPVRKSRT